MWPARMKKVVIVGLKDDRPRVLSLLHDLRIVQVEPVGKGAQEFFGVEKGGTAERRIADTTLRFKALVSALPKVPVAARDHFPDSEALLQAAEAIPIDDRVFTLKRREDELVTQENNLSEDLESLEEFSFFPEDLSILRAKSIFSFFGTLAAPRFDAFQAESTSLSKDLYISRPVPSADGKNARFVVVVPRENAEAFARLTHKLGAHLVAVPEHLSGPPASAAQDVQTRLHAVREELEGTRSQLMEISREWYPKILPIEEELVVEARKAEVVGKLGKSDRCFALEGWVPAKQLGVLETGLKQATNDRYFLTARDDPKEAPTMLNNPKGANVYEFFIRFYSLPQSGEIDPTMVFAIIFPFFFGFMLGDAGYAAFILAVCLWIIWRVGNPNAGPTIVPKFLVSFVTRVMPPSALKQLAKTFVAGCIIAIAFGITFDSYFGFTLGQWTLGHFNFAIIAPQNGIPAQVYYVAKLLLITVYIGLGMVTLGLIFGMVNAYYHANTKHLIGKLCWILVAWGITLAGLSLVHHYPGSWLIASSSFFDEYLIVTIAGVVGILATEGAMAAIELPSIMSHVLSYARLVGILLASVILAYVINYIAVIGSATQPSMLSHGAVYAVFAILLVVVGAVFNIILGVFEPGIQGARLLYVEHFSKFYTGNGKAFAPFGARRLYTRPQLLDQHPELRP